MSSQDRLDSVEGKLHDIHDKLSAFPVVGQRVADIERRLAQVESDIRILDARDVSHTASIAKIGGVFSVLGVLGAVVARQIIEI